MFLFLFVFFFMRLLSSFFSLKQLFLVKNGLTTLLLVFGFVFVFLKIPKIWVGWTTLNGEKKRGWPYKFMF